MTKQRLPRIPLFTCLFVYPWMDGLSTPLSTVAPSSNQRCARQAHRQQSIVTQLDPASFLVLHFFRIGKTGTKRKKEKSKSHSTPHSTLLSHPPFRTILNRKNPSHITQATVTTIPPKTMPSDVWGSVQYESGNEIRTMRFKKEGNGSDFGSGGYLFGRHRECDKMYVHSSASLICYAVDIKQHQNNYAEMLYLPSY